MFINGRNLPNDFALQLISSKIFGTLLVLMNYVTNSQ